MKNKKLVISIIITICALFIILVIIQALLRDSKETPSTNFVQNQSESNTNATSVTVNNSVNEVNNIVTENTVNNVVKNEQKVTADEAYKKALLDEEWVKENLYLKENCFGKPISSSIKQNVKFIRAKSEDSSTPIVLIYTECKKQTSCQCFIMTYSNGEIQVNSLDSGVGHTSHVAYGVNIRNKVLYKRSIYSLTEEYQIFIFTENGATKKYTIKAQQNQNGSSTTYYINEKKSTKEEYEKIKEQYINKTARGAEFININEEDINNNFK